MVHAPLRRLGTVFANSFCMTETLSDVLPSFAPVIGMWSPMGFARLCAGEQDRVARGVAHDGLVVGVDLAPLGAIEARLGPGLREAGLAQVAVFLRQHLRQMDHIGQTGPNEFSLLWPGARADAATLGRIQQLNQDMNRLCLNWHGQAVFLGAAVSVRPLGGIPAGGTGRRGFPDLYYKSNERTFL